MTLPSLFRWHRDPSIPVRREASPYASLLPAFDRMFDELWRNFDVASPWTLEGGGFQPRVDLEENDAELRVTAELPGLESKDFDIEFDGDVLTLKGEKRVERDDRSRGYSERLYGTFQRSIQLPCEVDADKVSAEYRNGILTVVLPKPAEAAQRTRRIEVRSS